MSDNFNKTLYFPDPPSTQLDMVNHSIAQYNEEIGEWVEVCNAMEKYIINR